MSFDDKRRSGWRADLTVRFGLRNLKGSIGGNIYLFQ